MFYVRQFPALDKIQAANNFLYRPQLATITQAHIFSRKGSTDQFIPAQVTLVSIVVLKAVKIEA